MFDFSPMLDNLDFSQLDTALLSVAGLVVAFILVRNGIDTITNFLEVRRVNKILQEDWDEYDRKDAEHARDSDW